MITHSDMGRTLTPMLCAFLSLSGAACGDDATSPSDPAAYVRADGIRGGKLYDKFWAGETGWSTSDPGVDTYSQYSEFFRCKQCHGWDLLGSAGAYISRSPKANRPNVSAPNLREIARNKTPQQLFEALRGSAGRRGIGADLASYSPQTNATLGDQMPDYGAILTEAQIWDLVKFMKEEALNVALLYDAQISGSYPTGSITYSNIGKGGNEARGNAIYAANCEYCHGFDGRAMLVDGHAYTVGSHLRAKPYEDQHKIKFGQLGSVMPPVLSKVEDMRDLYRALANPSRYPDPR